MTILGPGGFFGASSFVYGSSQHLTVRASLTSVNLTGYGSSILLWSKHLIEAYQCI